MIRIAEREYGFAEPPAGEAPEVTLRLLATMEYVKETLAELDAEAAMLPGGRNHDSRARAVGSPRLLTPPITGAADRFGHLISCRGDKNREALPFRRYPEPCLVRNAHVSGREVMSDGLLDLREESQPIWLRQ
jgi:hypothetical protein